MTTLTPGRILPEFAQLVTALPGDSGLPTPALPERLAGATGLRQQEYLAGRRCAAEALRMLGDAHWMVEIGTGAAGEPLWPAGYTGSITHTRGVAWSVVARSEDAAGIGLDLEVLVDADRAARVSRLVLHACETRLKAPGFGPSAVFTVAFSAKEALFKCLYPLVRRRFDYRDAAVRSIDVERRQVEIELLTNLGPDFPRGRRFSGQFDVCAGMVSTGFCIPRGGL